MNSRLSDGTTLPHPPSTQNWKRIKGEVEDGGVGVGVGLLGAWFRVRRVHRTFLNIVMPQELQTEEKSSGKVK